jgi:putative endopeptidase
MPDLIGKYYVDKAFPGSSKQIAVDMIQNIKQAFNDRLPALDWMDGETASAARVKLQAFTDQIGYTDKWQSYLPLADKLNPATYFYNIIEFNKLNFDIIIKRLYKPVDKTIWQMVRMIYRLYSSTERCSCCVTAHIVATITCIRLLTCSDSLYELHCIVFRLIAIASKTTTKHSLHQQ